MAEGAKLSKPQVMAFVGLVTRSKKAQKSPRSLGNGFKRAGGKIKEALILAGRSGDGFKQAGQKVKESSDLAQRSGDGFKQASNKIKSASSKLVLAVTALNKLDTK